jgi:MinD-like ATPase involved in chromosome partitioning or flagellar assembly
MSGPIKTLLIVEAGVDPYAIEAALPTESLALDLVKGIDRIRTQVDERSSDLLLVATSGESDPALELIQQAARECPERPIVVLATGEPNGFLMRAFAAGADDLVVLPAAAGQVGFAIEKVLARRRRATADVEQSPMVCVLGPKGGTGKTLTACNLAVSFAKQGNRAALVDLDLQFGDVGIALGLTPERTIYDLVASGGSLDEEKLEGYLTVHPGSGLRVLLAPTQPAQAGVISVEFLQDVYRSLRGSSDVVVVDTPPAFSPEVIASVDLSTHLCVVGTLDALSLKDTKLGLETLELMGHDLGDVKLVLNRATANVGITRGDAESILARRPDVFVPEDREIPRMLTEGRPVVIASQRSAAARAYAGFAAEYLRAFDNGTANAEDEPKRGLFRLFRGRAKRSG